MRVFSDRMRCDVGCFRGLVSVVTNQLLPWLYHAPISDVMAQYYSVAEMSIRSILTKSVWPRLTTRGVQLWLNVALSVT